MTCRAALLRSCLLLLAVLSGQAGATTYSAPGGTVGFEYRVAFIGVRGTGTELQAEATFTPGDLTSAVGTVTVPAASLKTGIGLQEDHMRGALAAERFPTIVYTLSGVNSDTMLTEGQTLVTTGSGRLSLKGETRSLTVPLKLTLSGGRVTVASQFKFNPHDYGVDYLAGADSIAISVGFVLAPKER